MRYLICDICEKEFETNHSTVKTCSKECRLVHRRLYQEEQNKKKGNKYRKAWLNKPKNREKANRYLREYRKGEGGIKSKIRNKTSRDYGSAKKCETCGTILNVQHHHLKPYNSKVFIDLCKKCHLVIEKYKKRQNKLYDDAGI